MMKRDQLAKKSNGFAFVAALLVMLVLAVLTVAILTVVASGRNLSSSRHEYTGALYVAEAGLNDVIARLRDGTMPSNWNEAIDKAHGYTREIIIDDRSDSNAANDRKGSYIVWQGHWQPSAGLVRDDVIVLTSEGTVDVQDNGPQAADTMHDVTRTVRVNLDTNGDWAWNHVYCTDDPDPDYQMPPYADVNGASGDIVPSDYLDEHGPAGSPKLPTPKWDEWEATARALDTLPYSNVSNGIAEPTRHVYWSGQNTSTHTGAGHTHYNYFTPDPYFPALSYPAAYGCSDFTVEFRKQAGVDYDGVYYVHGNVIVKNGVTIRGTIVATGNVTFQGQAINIIPLVTNEQDCETRTVYPALIAGRDVEIRDQSTFHTTGIIWAGHSFTAKAADQAGCIVSPHITLTGNFSVTYGFDTTNPECPRYEPGDSPPPMFNEPDMGALQPFPHTWREL